MRNSESNALLDDLLADLSAIRDAFVQAKRNCAAFGGRGYPTSSMPSSAIGSGRVSDPVGLEVERGGTDRARDDLRRAEADLADVRGGVRRLYRFVTSYTVVRSNVREEDVNPVETIWCSHHTASGMAEPIGDHGRNGLCRWCGDFADAHDGLLPPKGLLEKRARGERIYDKDIDRALREKKAS